MSSHYSGFYSHNNPKPLNGVSYARPFFSYLTKQLANEALTYEQRKKQYEGILKAQEVEIEDLKRLVKEKRESDPKYKENKRKLLEDKLNEIKGVYQKVRDVKKQNMDAYSRIKSNFQSKYGSRMNSLRNYSIRRVDYT